MPLPAKQLVINDTLVNYYHHVGEADKPVLVFLHGWRSEGKVWQEVITQLSDYTSYSLDLPGFGSSPAPKRTFHLGDYVAVVEGFIKKNSLANVIVIGHSFGGRIAIKLATTHPAYLQKIVLVDSAGIRRSSTLRTLKQGIAKIVKPLFFLPGLQGVRRAIYIKLGAEDYLATPSLQQTFVHVVTEDLPPLLSQITQPTLLLWGEDDTDTPVRDARTMEQMVPSAKLVMLEGAGHFSFLDKPQEFVSTLKKFV